jgi:hypothetical protein
MTTNRDRRKWAMPALVAFAKATRTDLKNNFYLCISDLVANLGHVAQKHGRSAGYTAFDMYEHAVGMFSAENRDPDGEPDMNDEVQILAPGRDVYRQRAKSKPTKSKRTAACR